ncbi:glycosyltransferase family 2 protein [Paraburkholderia tropica]|uniref:glycosyltransferase family 2 protein n=1 Tax=Paraburkholderia tropica TaxID=92647 RepID=UPI002AB6208E|nr:glycosyltransferase family 2 protein [Paraburkholderia tropica]
MQIAVVIPCYNASAYIDATLKTVTSQTHNEVEILIVDDGSSDDSLSKAREHLNGCRHRWTILTQSHKGVSAARNLGWQSTTADWIQFLDADDFLAREKLQLQSIACGTADPGVAYVMSRWEEVAVELDTVRRVRLAECSAFSSQPGELEILAKGPLLHLGQSLFSRRWIADVAGFDENLKVDEDQDFLLKLARKGAKILTVESADPLFAWRQQLHRRLGLRGARYNAIDLAEQYMENFFRITDGNRRSVDRLSENDQAMLKRRLSSYMRLLYRYDIRAFRTRLAQLDQMFGRFLPLSPSYLKTLSRFVGFERAEDVAAIYRRGKAMAGAGV